MSLSSLVDNLSEINNKDRKKCMERNKIRSECEFVGIKDNRLKYECKKCDDISAKSVNELIEKFPDTYQFCNKDLNKFALLFRKGVYPYEYIDSWERFNETSLPDKESFYSNLNLESITDEGYVHAQKVWKVFKIKNLGEYHDLYVQSDTLLLVDVYENFRERCIDTYEIDPAHFLSAPGLAWQACLKKIKVKLELLTGNDMLMMFEKGTRGGMCHAIYRHAKANNKYMKNYDKNIESPYLVYLDANNLYGWAMSQKLPVGNFKWIEKDDLLKFDEKFIKNYDENSDKGYIFHVDVEYLKNLHKLHSDLPFLPERMKINKCSKLTCTVQNKKDHVIHIRTLKQALNNELILKKVHRVIQFNQEAWLKPYIDMNTKLRKEAQNDFEKDFFKLMNNSVFGKTMENIRNHRDIKIVTTNKQRNRLASEPNYHITKYIAKDLLIMEMKKVEVKMNKSIYLAQAILDISKILMYEFWYDYIKPKSGDKAKFCYTDTDSFAINIFTETFLKILAMMLKDGLIHLTMMKMIKDHFQLVKIKK